MDNSNSIKNITGAIFDLDGTILDSMFIWNDIGYKFLEMKKIKVPAGADKQFTQMSLQQAAEYYIEHFDNTATIKSIINDINMLVEGFYFNEVIKKNGIQELLEYLKSKGVKMCVATATDKYMVEKALERNGLLHYFSEIFTCNGVGAGKDTAVIYDKALEHLGTDKAATYVFEDALYAIKTAHNDGYNVVGIKDVSEPAEPEEVKSYCDYYINSYEEIYLSLIHI